MSSPALRVLYLSGLQVHPPLSGGHLRSYALASALRRHGLDVFVYSLVGRKADYFARRPSATQRWPSGVEEHVDRRLSFFAVQYGSYGFRLPPLWITAYLRASARARGRLLPSLLRERLGGSDVVLADFPFLHPVFGAPGARGKVRVVNTHNVEHRLCPERGPLLKRWVRPGVRRVEIEAAGQCDVLVACSGDDQRWFDAHAPVKRSVLVPNGVDLRRFDGLAAHREEARRKLGLADGVRAFLFTASKYGPNQEAYDYLLGFARAHGRFLEENRIHLLVVGNVAAAPVRVAGLTATGRVDAVEPYFAAADAALNPLASGAGTNVKMGEFMAARLPVLSTPFGARGYAFEDGKTGFLFEKNGLAPALLRVGERLDRDPEGLRRLADEAFARNEGAIDMDACARGLVETIDAEHRARRQK